MLGLLCVSQKKKHLWSRISIVRQKLARRDVYCITIPKITHRNLRKAARYLKGMRVLIPNMYSDASLFRNAGIDVISFEELPYRLAFSLYKKTLADFKINSHDVMVSVLAGYIGEEAERTLGRIAQNARYLALRCGDTAVVSQKLLQNYGIAALPYPPSIEQYPEQVILFFRKDVFSIQVIHKNKVYRLKSMECILPERFFDFPATHSRSAAMAFLQSGELKEAEITISSVLYHEVENN